MANYYDLLGVAREATAAEVRQAYLRLAREKHPDRFPDPVEKERAQSFFQDLTAAFNALFNESSRRAYDADLAQPRPVSPTEIAEDAHRRGLKMMEAGQLDEAVTLFRTAVHHSPEDAQYNASLGRALARHPPAAREAMQALERSVQLSPKTASFHAELAALLFRQGLRLRAQKEADLALRLDPREPLARKVAEQLGQA